MRIFHKLILPLFNLIAMNCYHLLDQCKPKIAIIGGGIGGASSAHFISQLFNDDVDIDLIEGYKIGGRLATVKFGDGEFEAGGSIIHDRNLLMKSFLKELGLEKRPQTTTELYGIWNGDKFVFKESSYSVVNMAKLFYRYGLEPLHLQRYVSSVLDDFEKIYKLHDRGRAFTNVTSLLAAMNPGFPQMLEVSMREHLEKLGYSSSLIDELVQATLVVNYGQEADVHSFVGCVSVAGMGSDLWAVKGGNKRVVEGLINLHGNIEVRKSVVKGIVYNKDGDHPYTIKYSDGAESYDVVIIAAPLTSDHEWLIKFQNFPDSDFEFPGRYQTTYATFVEGQLNSSYFDLDKALQGILSCNPDKTIISSVGRLSSVEGAGSYVWKIFTRQPATEELLDKMFYDIKKTEPIVFNWKAYPKYSTIQKSLNFKLHDGLYHVNAIEWAASAMEMSAIGGRNVAILAYNDFKKKCSRKSKKTQGTIKGPIKGTIMGELKRRNIEL